MTPVLGQGMPYESAHMHLGALQSICVWKVFLVGFEAHYAAHEAAVQVKSLLRLASLHIDVFMPYAISASVLIAALIIHWRCQLPRRPPLLVNLICPASCPHVLPVLVSARHECCRKLKVMTTPGRLHSSQSLLKMKEIRTRAGTSTAKPFTCHHSGPVSLLQDMMSRACSTRLEQIRCARHSL